MLITFSASKGAPGVTTTMLGMATTWPKDVLVVEADMDGSAIIPGLLRGQVTWDRGIIQMLGREISVEELWRNTIEYTEKLRILPGIRKPSQAPALKKSWAEVAALLLSCESAGIDVLVDLGRCKGQNDERLPLLQAADLNLLITSSRLPDIATTLETAKTFPRETKADLDPTRLLVVGPGRPYGAKEIAKQVGLHLLGTISWDPVNAEHLSVGAPASKRYSSSPLVKSMRAAGEAARTTVTTRRQIIGQTS